MHRLGDSCVGWVLDLRNCPGGQLTEALAQASLLLPNRDATLAYTVDAAGFFDAHTVGQVLERSTAGAERGEMASLVPGEAARLDATAEQRAGAEPGPAAPAAPAAVGPSGAQGHVAVPAGQPIVVLIDRGTASSAELFAAAIRDNGRGTLLGEHSFGKGLIQRIFPLPDGGALKLTIGEYRRPNMARVERGVGLQPDVTCAPSTPGSDGDACVKMAASLVRRGGAPLN